MSSSPLSRIRSVSQDDLQALPAILRAYMRETYDAVWHGSAEALARDVAAGRCGILVAEAEGEVVGVVAWTRSYDLHHCVAGGEVIDLYVVPAQRGRGIAPALLCAAAEAVRADGGSYIKGAAVPTGAGGRLYGRVAVCHPEAACIVGGRAFRHLAGLAGRPPREVLRSLPDRAWNHEA